MLEVKTLSSLLALRLVPPLLCICSAALVAPRVGWAAAATAATLGPLAICAAAPLSAVALRHAYTFRLNEGLVAALQRSSTVASLALMPLLGVAAAAGAAVGSTLPLAAAAGLTAASVAVTALLSTVDRPASRDDKVKMVYAGPVGGVGVGLAGAAGGAAAPAAAAPEPSSSSSSPEPENPEYGGGAQVQQPSAPATPKFTDVDVGKGESSGGPTAAACCWRLQRPGLAPRRWVPTSRQLRGLNVGRITLSLRM